MGGKPTSHGAPPQDISRVSTSTSLSDLSFEAPVGISDTDDAGQPLDPMSYGGDFAWVGIHYKLEVSKGLSPLQWLNDFTKRVLVLHDIVFSNDGTFCRPGEITPLFPIQGVDLRWRWDAAQDRLIIVFWNRGTLQVWRWDELQIKDSTRAVPDFAGVGHVGKFSFRYELLRVPVDCPADSSELSTEGRLVLNLEPVAGNEETFPWWAAAVNQKRRNHGIHAMGSLFAQPPIEARLGGGSYGFVWRARHRESRQYFAVKNITVAWNEPVARAVAQNEIEILEKLRMQPHPCVVGVFAVEYFEIQRAGLYMLIMEFCSGGDLQEALDSHVGIDQSYKPPQEALRWIGQIFLATEHVHTKLNLLIRDLKPGNVVLRSGRGAKLTDFGYGRIMAESLTADLPGGHWSFQVPPGTRGYIAPELLSKRAFSYPVDIYSFGVLIWVLLSGGLRDHDRPAPPTIGFGHDFASFTTDWGLLQKALEHPETAKSLLPANASETVAAMTREQPQDRPDFHALRTSTFFCEHCLPQV